MENDPFANLSEEEWAERLTEEQFHILREHGTEPAFSGKYDRFYEEGVYHCVGCGTPLFSSGTKFSSGTGWPSFGAPLADEVVETDIDTKLLYPRTEVHCRRCGGHLGHIFDDGPPPTGKRYCLNSCALTFFAKRKRSQ